MRYGQKLRRSGSGNTHRAFIFGSFADGVQTADSDLDVLIETRVAMGLSFLSLIQDIERAAGF